MHAATVVRLVKKSLSEASEDKIPRLAAALSYYTLLSLSPLLALALVVAGSVFGIDAARGQIARELHSVFGPQASDAIQALVANVHRPGTDVLSAVAGGIVLLIGSSGVFGELQDSLNTIWEVAPRPDRGLKGILRDRFFSFTMVVGVAFLLLVSLVISAALAAIGHWFSGRFAGSEAIWHLVNALVSVGVIAGLFALVFKVVPDVTIAWKDVWIGATVTAALFVLGKLLIGLYVGKAAVASPFGAAGSLVVIVVWVYYSAHILFLGAEFTQVYARDCGSRITPARGAVPLTEQARANLGMPHHQAEP
jgi:membrane protein